MCDFVSWIEWQGQKYYLTGNDLLTPEGAAMLKSVFRCDLAGHGATRAYYPELYGRGCNKECVDFSSPANFPTEIADVIKAGMFRGIGYDLRLLTKAASIRWRVWCDSELNNQFWDIFMDPANRTQAWR